MSGAGRGSSGGDRGDAADGFALPALGGGRNAATARAPQFRLPLRVYYEDTDAAGVVYYANYLRYLERARSEWLEGLGHSPASVSARHGRSFVVRRARLDYLRPARLGERIEATLAVRTLSRVGIDLDQSVVRDGEALVEAHVQLACIDTASWRPARIPADLLACLENFR